MVVWSYVAYVPYQSTMAQQMSRLRQLVLLLLLWLAACRYAKSQAALLDVQIAGADAFKVNGNAKGDSNGSVSVDSGDVATALAVTSAANECFQIYLQDSHAASNTYATAYQICRDLGSESSVNGSEKQHPVREDVTLAMNDMCRAFYDCSHAESDLEFFQCDSRNSYKDINTILQVYMNSTAAILELENKYQEAEKEILLCTITAQRQYMNSTSSAYLRLTQCLKSG